MAFQKCYIFPFCDILRISRDFPSIECDSRRYYAYFFKKYQNSFVISILQTAKAEIPGCNFLDTLTGEFHYTKTESGYYSTVKSHIRGCVCKLKPCLTFCCRFKHTHTSGECNDGLMKELAVLNPYLKVTLNNGSVVRRNLLQDFIVLRDQMRAFDGWEEDSYTLYKNGSVILGDYKTMAYRGYDCLHPSQFGSGDPESLVVAFHARHSQPTTRPRETELIVISEIFLIFTIAVYICVKKLRNVQGKCFISYMVCTFMFLLHAWLGYLNYFFLLAKFIWLFIMNFRKWKGLTSVNCAKSPYSFRTYSIFAWGTAALMTGLIVLMDLIWDDEPNKVKWVPGVGYESCDLKQTLVSHNAYVSAPLILLVTLSTTLFILTTIKIIKIRRSLRLCVVQDVITTGLYSKIKTYTIFVRLFIIMVMESGVRLIVFYADCPYIIKRCFYIVYSIGILIFGMFVLRLSTIRLLTQSFRERISKLEMPVARMTDDRTN